MQEILVGTIKVVAALAILAVIARFSREGSFEDPFFESQKWTLDDAYRVLIPILVLVYLQYILHQVLPPYPLLFVSLLCVSLYCTSIFGCYYAFIKKPYRVNWSAFGLDKAKFLKSGVRNANIAVIFLVIMLIGSEVPNASGSSTGENMLPEVLVYLVTLLLACFAGPFFEELLCRGILYAPVARKLGTWKAVGLLSVVGSLSHLHYGLVSTFVGLALGVAFYYSYIRSTSLYGPIIWHSTINFCVDRSKIALLLTPYIHSNTLNKCYICILLFGLLIINAFRLKEFLKRRRLQHDCRV
jgi:membrane protease YdiL (CAAX protease family)